jgi:two-component system chemotaxis response regulator CheB
VALTERVRVLIVDDSALMRKILSDMLKGSPEIEVVATARGADEALDLASRLRPDVITLDVEMPGKSGLDILPALVASCAAVIMLSSFTREGADVTLAALELGAIDFLAKPDHHQITQLRESREVLVSKILAAAEARAGSASSTRSPIPQLSHPASRNLESSPDGPRNSQTPPCVVIGISTGGPQALRLVLPRLTPPIPPVLIVQHMPAQFTGVFADRLNRACSVVVKEAEDGEKVVAGQVLIAPGGRHLTVIGHPPHARLALSDGPSVSSHRPSIDVLFGSAARAFQAGTVGIIMTGMGRDGVEGCHAILAAGGVTFGQDEVTSAVYGMNKVAANEGAIGSQFPLESLPLLIKRFAFSGQ